MKQMSLWVLPFVLVLSSLTAFAQSTNSGDIRGTVTDATGALVPDVTVTVTNVDTGVAKVFTSNQAGLYDTNSIVTGSYTVTFSKNGFDRLVRGPVTVDVGFTTVNGELKVGAATEEVTVTTDVPLLQTENGEQNTTLEQKALVALPQVTQDWENFTILLPGAAGCSNNNDGACSQGTNNPGQVVAVNGNLPYSNILADGASTTLSHSQNANPSTFENVDELQVNTSSFSAQYGIGGIIFNQVTKGGTNKFHGTAYDFLQNDAFTAYPYEFGLTKATGLQPIPFLRYNNFGGSIGGPILKNKMFFYFNYDQIVNHTNNHGYNTLPTDANIGGDFTGINTLYDPTTQTIALDGKGNPYPVRQSFASENTGSLAGKNAIPTTMFDSVAAKFQQMFFPTTASHASFLTPIPNGQSIGGEGQPNNNWYYNQLVSDPAKRYFGRLDWDVKSNNRITMSDTQADFTYPGLSSIATCPVGCQNGYVDNNNAQVSDVWNISSTIVNEARIGYTNQMNYFTDSSLSKGYAAQLGWQFAKVDDFPGFETTGTYPYSWLTPGSNSVYKEHVFDYSDVVTMIRGKHILHFGGEFLQYRDNSTAWGNKIAGNMQYSGQYTKQWTTNPAVCGASAGGAACTVPGTGFEYADFLLGYINNWQATQSPEYGARLKSPQMFVQDDIKVRPNLTLNLGLRYQINHGWNEVHGNIASFDPTVINPATSTLGAYWFASTHANGRTALENNVFNTVLPRVGFAWAARPNTTVRGGFGLYAYNWSLDTYGHGMGSSFGANGNYSDPTNGVYPAATLGGNGDSIKASSFYNGPPQDSGSALPYTSGSQDPTRFNNSGVDYQLYHAKVPKIYQWNFGVERQLGTQFMAQVAYVGSHGFNLAFPVDINQVPQSKWTPTNSQQFRPYPIYQSIYGGGNSGTENSISNYHSLQASISKRMAHGLSLNFNYTWSHFLDDMDSSGWGSRGGTQPYQNSYDPSANYSNSNFDVRNAFKGYAVYQLPFGRGKQFLSGSRWLDEAVGGWQISGTVVLQSGQPFSVYGDQANYSLAGNPFPNRNPGTPLYDAHKGVNGWFNSGAFLKPTDGTWGDVRRNSLYGPGMNVFNMSAAKSFGLPWESVKIEFRADASNAFNHPSFQNPGGVHLGSSAGAGLPYASTDTISNVNVGGRNLQLMFRVTF